VTDQSALFEKGASWEEAWHGMPEFVQEDLTPVKSITVRFRSAAEYREFAGRVEQSLTPNTRSIWYPEAEIGRMVDKKYVDGPLKEAA
jgi:hypothetical protein